MTSDQIRKAIREIRSITDKPFAVNLFIPELSRKNEQNIEEINRLMDGYRMELGIPPSPEPDLYHEPLEKQMEVILEEKVPVLSFTFGVLTPEWIDTLKRQGTKLIGTATTVAEGAHLETEGIDIVVGQGSEAGGHRSSFLGHHDQGLVGTMALIPQLADRLHVPVIASGGIMDGRGITAALALGACGVQMGSAFLTCTESTAHPLHKQALRQSIEESTVISCSFSGKPARGIRNRFIVEMKKHEELFPPYPVQNALTRDIRDAAGKQNKIEFMSFWGGQASRLCMEKPAGELVTELVRQTEQVLDRIQKNDLKRSE
jgi:nitronate monooxygenase